MWQDRVQETSQQASAVTSAVSRRASRPLRAQAGSRWSAGERRWQRSRVVHVDCGTCTARGAACGDCVIGVLLGPPGEVELDDAERAALSTLAASGMVPPLRLVQPVSAPEPGAPAEADPLEPAGPAADDGWGLFAGDSI